MDRSAIGDIDAEKHYRPDGRRGYRKSRRFRRCWAVDDPCGTTCCRRVPESGRLTSGSKARTFHRGYSTGGGNMPRPVQPRHAWTSSAGGPAWCCWLAPGARQACAPGRQSWVDCAGRSVPLPGHGQLCCCSDGSAAELRINLDRPAPYLPILSRRCASRLRQSISRQRIGELWARFSRRSCAHAWSQPGCG